MSDPATDAINRNNRSSYLGHQPPVLIYPGLTLTPDLSYKEQYPLWRTIRDCFAGEARVKQQGELYLRRLSAHDKDQYDTYLNRAYFYNAVRRTHVGLMGSLFRKPPEVSLPSAIKINLENVTLDQESFKAFSRTVGSELLLTSRYGILVDFKDNDPRNCYMAGYTAENIYAWRHRIHQGRKIVDRVILIENEDTPTEYGNESTQLIRILRLDDDPTAAGQLVYSQDVIRPNVADQVKGAPTRENISFNTRGRTLRYIPFIFLNASDLLPEAKAPVLWDIASINISHYSSTAHLEHGRFYAGMPTYVTSGDTQEIIPGLGSPDPLTVGPSNVWELEKDAKAFLLEFTGHGLTFLENAVDSKQLQMQSLGGRLISSTRRAAAMSDEAWQLLETGDEATLLDVAQQMDAGMARALSFMAHIRGELSDPFTPDNKITAEFNKEFVRSDLTARELRALQSLYERGIIPLDVMYYALREVHVIPIEYTLEDFKALLEKKDQIYEAPAIPLDPNKITSRPTLGLPGGRPGVRAPQQRVGSAGGTGSPPSSGGDE